MWPLSRLSHGSQAVRASLAVGYQGPHPEAQRLFRLLGLLEAPDFATWPAAALLGMPYAEAEDLMEELADIRLLEVAGRDPTGQTRYRLHDLTRAYARECGEQRDSEDERAAALRRVLSAWLTLTRQAHVRLCGGDYRLPRPTSPSWAAAVDVAGRHVLPDPLGWADAERAGIVAAVRQCAALGAHEIGWELAAAGLHLFETRGHHDEWRITHEIALPAARAAGDVRGQAHMLNGLGRMYFSQGRLEHSISYTRRAMRLAHDIGDVRAREFTRIVLGEIELARGDLPAAEMCFTQAMDGLGTLGFPMGIAYARLGLATAGLARHDLTDADHLLGQALAAYRDAFDTVGQARVLLASAEVRRRQRRFGEAIAMLTDAAATYQAIASPYRYGVALRALAEVHREAGDLSSAIETWERCLKTLTALNAPEANEVAALLRRHAPGRHTGDRTVTAAGSGSAEAFRAS